MSWNPFSKNVKKLEEEVGINSTLYMSLTLLMTYKEQVRIQLMKCINEHGSSANSKCAQIAESFGQLFGELLCPKDKVAMMKCLQANPNNINQCSRQVNKYTQCFTTRREIFIKNTDPENPNPPLAADEVLGGSKQCLQQMHDYMECAQQGVRDGNQQNLEQLCFSQKVALNQCNSEAFCPKRARRFADCMDKYDGDYMEKQEQKCKRESLENQGCLISKYLEQYSQIGLPISEWTDLVKSAGKK
eukprot:TRINITY_DN6963_c0_g1_i1.p1 TRINITY_DN6963_c0_g1~~TRINITY_DN6963_c0_g1_i1.p1  ORF type:complete len:245 (+),score=27.78 TRINITY_DN6963_c0_g1_i1:134-868(+)